MFDTQDLWLVSLIAIVFVTVGVGMTINIVWGLVTGGPRAKTLPGAPYLYDRLYYLLFGFGLVGWWIAIFSFFGISEASVSSFMIGWGIGAIPMGLLLWLRGDMLIDGATYLSAYGFWLFRFFHASQGRQFGRIPRALRKLMAAVFFIAGIGVLAFNLPQIGRVPGDVASGAHWIAMSLVHRPV